MTSTSFVFEREGCKPFCRPSLARLQAQLARIRSSFASLSAPDGSYLQISGGPTLFVLEHRNANGVHYRAFQETPVVPFPDGTRLESSAGSILMDRVDWFQAGQVLRVFSAFIASEPWPATVHWRKLNAAYEKPVA